MAGLTSWTGLASTGQNCFSEISECWYQGSKMKGQKIREKKQEERCFKVRWSKFQFITWDSDIREPFSEKIIHRSFIFLSQNSQQAVHGMKKSKLTQQMQNTVPGRPFYFNCNRMVTGKQLRFENCTQYWMLSPDSRDIHGSLILHKTSRS